MVNDLRAMHSGQRVHLLDPNPAVVDVDDLARGLSTTYRFAGQTHPCYSVAQHCLVLADWSVLQEPCAGQPLYAACLLHDAAEAYLGDLHPALRSSEFDALEMGWLKAIYQALGVPWSLDAHNQALVLDKLLLQHELAYFGLYPTELPPSQFLQAGLCPWIYARQYYREALQALVADADP